MTGLGGYLGRLLLLGGLLTAEAQVARRRRTRA